MTLIFLADETNQNFLAAELLHVFGEEKLKSKNSIPTAKTALVRVKRCRDASVRPELGILWGWKEVRRKK